MIVVKLQGGLGNQMFQYALGRALSIRLNTSMKLDLSFLLNRTLNENYTLRSYELDIFNLNVELATSTEINKYICSYTDQPKLALWKLHRKTFNYNCYKEKVSSFDAEVFSLKGNIYLDGYWQTSKYFNEVKSIILKDFSFKEYISSDIKKLADEIYNSNSLCLNVRRGDYVSNPETNKFHGVQGIDYFEAAIPHISQIVENLKIYIFSDDINWCVKNINFNFPTTFVEYEYPNRKSKDYFRLMSLCKYFIIANSTFGWWAAWLNQNPNKIVVAPRKWFNDPTIDTSDLTPENWIRI
jgi:Glycosyl transferase family 11